MEFVACKMVGEYNRNKEKIRKFYLDEQKEKNDDKRTQVDAQPDTEDIAITDDQPGPSNSYS